MKKFFLFLSFFYLLIPFSLKAQLTSNAADKAVLKALEQFRQNNIDSTTIPVLQTLTQDKSLTDSLRLLANAYLDTYNFFNNASSFNMAELEETAKLLKGNGENTEYALCGIEIAYSNNQNFLKAIEYGQRVLKLRKHRLGVYNPDYALSLSTLSLYSSSLGDYNKAIEYNQKALAIREKVLGKIHPDYATSLNNLADCYSSLGDYNKAIELDPNIAYAYSYRGNSKFKIGDQKGACLDWQKAKELGCTPDYDAWKSAVNPRPDGDRSFRTAAGHLHFGFIDSCDAPITDQDFIDYCSSKVRELDFYLALPSLFYDADVQRRELYGKAGAFRPKVYGLEYRTLSNMWLKTTELKQWAYRASIEAWKRMESGVSLFEKYGDIQSIINTSNKEAAMDIIKAENILLPQGI